DDGQRREALASERLPERRLPRPELPRGRLVHDRDRRVRLRLAVGEIATLEDGCADDREVAGQHPPEAAVGAATFLERARGPEAAILRRIDGAGALDARYASDALQQPHLKREA